MSENSFLYLTGTSSSMNLFLLSKSALACAITKSPSSIADRYSNSSVTLPALAFLNGLSKKPYSFVLAKAAREFIKPIFGPSGVSIGQTLP